MFFVSNILIHLFDNRETSEVIDEFIKTLCNSKKSNPNLIMINEVDSFPNISEELKRLNSINLKIKNKELLELLL